MPLTGRYNTFFPGDTVLVGMDFSTVLPPGVGIQFPGQDFQVGTAPSGQVTGISLTSNGAYTAIPAVTIDPPPAGIGSAQATAVASLAANGPVTVTDGGSLVGIPSPVGSTLTFPNGIVIQVTQAANIPGAFLGNLPAWYVIAASIVSGGLLMGVPGTPVPANPMQAIAQSGSYTIELWPSINVTWQIWNLGLTNGGAGYTAVPNVTISPGPATATATANLVSGTPALTIPTPRLEIYSNLSQPVPVPQNWYVNPILAPPGNNWWWSFNQAAGVADWFNYPVGFTPPNAIALGTAVRGREVISIVSGGAPANTDYQFRWIISDTLGNRWTRTGLLLVGQTS